jgi:hypothetical protein
MSIINVKNSSYIDENNLGAIICHTPKGLTKYALVRSTDELESVFGDPYINPSLYSDLILAHDLVRLGVPLYISSVHDMKEYSDEFEHIPYNSYTEFFFRENEFDVVGYKLKSDIKFVQPLIQKIELANESNKLYLYVQLYYLDRQMTKTVDELYELNSSHLYQTIKFIFDANTVTDKDIQYDFLRNGLELKILYSGGDNKALVEEFKEKANRGRLEILLRSTVDQIDNFITTDDYRYNIHSGLYAYDFIDERTVLESYTDAIDEISGKEPSPLMLCFGTMYHATEIKDHGNILGSPMSALDPESRFGIYNHLLEKFNEDCDTYLFISAPDLSVSTTIKLLSRTDAYQYAVSLYDHFNCDLFYGYATDYVDSSLVDRNPKKVEYSAAVLSFYNLMITSAVYMTNNFLELNISNRCVKLILSERSAEKLKDNRCNSMVLFDIGSPSVYGDRSLSLLPNLRYSHVSRNYVRLRRLIREYLETRKFILNTLFNVETCVNHIRFNILDEFKSQGVLSDYNVSYTIKDKTVYIKVILLFSLVTESITLDFTI